MAKKFLVNIDLGWNQIVSPRIGNLSADPTASTAGKGGIYYNTSSNVLKVSNGTSWDTVSFGAGSFYIGSTSISLGNSSGSVTTIAGLTSVTSTTFIGALQGNADTATKSTNLIGGNGTTLLGAIPYQSSTDTTSLLSPNTTTTKKFLRQTGTGTNGAAPAWDTLVDGDIPSALTGKTYNGLTITSTTGTLTITNAKTLSVSNTLTLAGTDGTTMTFPSSSSTVMTLANPGTLTGTLTLRAGTATAGTAPVYFQTGTNLTTPAAGAMEFDGTNFYLTPSTSRYKVAFLDGGQTFTSATWNGTAIVTTYGGTGLTSYTAGDMLYYASGTALSKLSIGTSNYVMTSSGTAPQWTAQSSLSVGSATNATNTAITDDTTTSSPQYITWVGATSGNNGQKVSSTKLTFTPSTGTLAATVFSGSGASLTNIPNSATTATSANTASAIVARDASGNFTAGTITAALSGNASTATALQTARTINGTSFDGTANITVTAAAGTLTGSTLASGVTASSLTSVGTLSGLAATGTVNFGSATTVTVPTPVNGTDAANKNYVDNVASGVNAHDAVQYATTTTIAGTYAAGTTGADGGTGVGATITYTSTGVTSIDSGSNLALNDRVLVKNGVTADSGTASKANGIYYVTTAGSVGVATVLTRALDADNSIAGDIMAGDLVYVIGGTTNGGTQWIQTATGTATTPTKGIKIGTDAITFTQFSGASATTAGAGLVANGNAFDVGTASTARIVVNNDNIDLATTAVSAGSYGASSDIQYPTFTVDAYGRLTAAATTTIRNATTTNPGVASFDTNTFTVTSGAVSVKSGGISNTQLANSTISGISLGSNLNALTAGTGLTMGGSTYNGGTARTLNYDSGSTAAGANDVGSSYSYATQKATATLTGTGSKTSWSISHNLGTRDVTVRVYQTSTTPDTQYADVEVDIVRTATGTITVTFASAPALNDTYNVVIVG